MVIHWNVECEQGMQLESKSGMQLQERILDLQVPDALARLEVFTVKEAALTFDCRSNDQGIVPGKPKLVLRRRASP